MIAKMDDATRAARAMKPGEDPVSHVRRLKETGISMTIKLKSTGNDFEGPWRE